MKTKKKNFIIGICIILIIVLFSIFGWGDDFKGALSMRFGIDIRGGVEAVFEPSDLDRIPTSEEMDAARNVIESRLDAKNILDREVTVDKEAGHIIVRFPWKSDEKNFNPEQSIAELGETAKLTFRDPDGNVLIEGKDVKNSSPVKNTQTGGYEVSLTFNSEGAELFEQATGDLIGKQMGIYMDDTLISNPQVQSKISGGQAVINGLSGYDEAKELADKINAGALPFSMITTNHSTISPTLGSGALKVMVLAGLLAFAVVCIFMISVYKLSGFISCIALVMQMALQLLALSIPQFTLTLPGIAGIILSLGMAVDANVIISERIGEEMKSGSSISQSIKSGYANAFASVLDGNVTSAIVAVILMIFGSGTMLSFGYTLLCGIVLNFVAGIFTSRKLLDSITLFQTFHDKKWFRIRKDRPTIHFYEKRCRAYAISIVLICSGIIVCFINGVKLDTQFIGGAILKYSFDGDLDLNEVSETASSVLNRPNSIQVTTDPATNAKKIVLTLAGNEGMSPDDQNKLNEALTSLDEDAHITLSESYVVEPYIGQKALKNSIIALVLSLVLITAYVWIRFRVLSGLSAGVMGVLALLHDVLIVFFVFVAFKIPLNDAFVAVTLTIIGYSINDTIVLYDRIRENRRKDSKIPLGELINLSTTQTLTRTMNSSFTTTACVLMILIFAVLYGITSIKVFALPMLFGLICGCYSSICIAAPLWVSWSEFKEKRMRRKE